MSETNEAKKSRLLKILAVIGFLVAIIIVLWLAVKAIQLLPSAFSSLASMADGLNNRPTTEETIVLENTDDAVAVNTPFLIEWNQLERPGRYALYYECVDGVSLRANINGELVAVDCNTAFILPQDTEEVAVEFVSTENRISTLSYGIGFVNESESEFATQTDQTIDIVNINISDNQLTLIDDAETETVESPVVTEETTGNDLKEPLPTAPIQTNNPSAPAGGVRYIEVEHAPISNPNGYVDLKVEYLGIGIITDDNRFIPRATIKSHERIAFQFSVTNIGSKDSSSWVFRADLPSGQVFESKTQTYLKTKERAVLTVAFDTPDTAGFQSFGASIYGGNDLRTANNSLSWGVHVEQ